VFTARYELGILIKQSTRVYNRDEMFVARYGLGL